MNIKAGGKEYELYVAKGTVLVINKVSNTHVHGSGSSSSVSVSSYNTIDSEIHLLEGDGYRSSFNLYGWDIQGIQGDKLKIGWVLPKGANPSAIEKRKYIYVSNDSTHLWWGENYINNLCSRPFRFRTKEIMGIAFLFGLIGNFLIMHDIANAIVMGIVFAFFGLVLSFIIGFALKMKSKALNEPKNEKLAILKHIKHNF